MAISPDTAQEQLNALRRVYAQQLPIPKKVHEIEAAWTLLNQDWNQDALKTLHRLIHNLNGSSASFGFTNVSNFACTLETLLESIIESGVQTTTEQRSQIDASLDGLKQAAVASSQNAQSRGLTKPSIFNYLPVQPKDNKLVFWVEDDMMLAQSLAAQIGQRGYSVHNFLHLVN